MYTSDKEAIILEHIYYNDSLKQRELADKAGISLGMTNAILKRLIEKGWLMTKRLNSRNISYVVSPTGMEEIFKRGYRYFKRTIDDVRLYKEEIERLVSEAVAAGYKAVALVGKSDLDFIVEYACGKARIAFEKTEINQIIDNTFIIYSEQYEGTDKKVNNHWLRTIVLKGDNKK
jgi:DNA-binding MarR family transcriptional regulator